MHERCDTAWYSMDRKVLYAILEKWRIRGLIATIDGEGIEEIQLTNKGRAYFLRSRFKALKIEHTKKWDKKWRLVMFDVPEQMKPVRDSLRRKLKQLGFLEFQKSVFVFPYPCDSEINFTINYFNIPQQVYCLESRITPDDKLRRHFKLK